MLNLVSSLSLCGGFDVSDYREGCAKYECRVCGKQVFLEKTVRLIFCPVCSTVLVQCPLPKHWVFQFNPSTYRWFDRIKTTVEPEQWLVSQHASLIRKGDFVAVWGSGNKSGIYATGQIITNPMLEPLGSGQVVFFSDERFVEKFLDKPSVRVKYSKVVLANPILEEDCRKDGVLSEMQILANSEGTNFRLGNEQWLKILSFMGERA